MGRRGHGERPAGAGEAGDEVAQRIGDRLGERLGHADRQAGAEGVAEAARVLDRDPALLAGHPHPDHPARGLQLGEPLLLHAAGRRLGGGEVADEAQQVGGALGVADVALRVGALQLPLDLGEDVAVEQLADGLRAQELGEQRGVEREGGGAALGQRGVQLVEEHPDVAEHQRARERRRAGGGHVDHLHRPRAHVAHELGEPRDVVDVLQDLAHRLQHHRELLEPARDAQQLGGLLALLPQRGAARRVAARAAAASGPRTPGTARRTARSC